MSILVIFLLIVAIGIGILNQIKLRRALRDLHQRYVDLAMLVDGTKTEDHIDRIINGKRES